jgi:hypothetical protein
MTKAKTPEIALRLLSAAAIFACLVQRFLFRAAPLDDTEGEFAEVGRQMLGGIAPYSISANMKFPGIYAVSAAAQAVFGETPAGLHLGLLCANLGAVVAVFFLARRLLDPEAGYIGAAAYALLSIGTNVYGMRAMAEHFVVLPVLLAALLQLRFESGGKKADLCASGLLYGLALLMKQTGVFFLLFGLYALLSLRRPALLTRASLVNAGLFLSCALLPLAVTAALLFQAGVFGKFWFWTVDYARAYSALIPWPDGPAIFWRAIKKVWQPDEGLWVLGVSGMVLAWNRCREPAQREAVTWLGAFCVFSLLSVCPGLYFRHYYFVLMLPALALCCAAAVVAFKTRPPQEKTGDMRQAALLAVALLWGLIPVLSVIYDRDKFYAAFARDPFTAIGAYLHDHTQASDRIAVLGSEPELYFYAGRLPASEFLFTFPLTETQPYAPRMQQQMIMALEAAAPAYVVAVDNPVSWMFAPRHCAEDGTYNPARYCDLFQDTKDSWGGYGWNYAENRWTLRAATPTRIFDWFSAWGPKHYVLAGLAERRPGAETVILWGAAAAGYKPQGSDVVRVYRRKAKD